MHFDISRLLYKKIKKIAMEFSNLFFVFGIFQNNFLKQKNNKNIFLKKIKK